MNFEEAILQRASEHDAELQRLDALLDTEPSAPLEPKDPLSFYPKTNDARTKLGIYHSHLLYRLQHQVPDLQLSDSFDYGYGSDRGIDSVVSVPRRRLLGRTNRTKNVRRHSVHVGFSFYHNTEKVIVMDRRLVDVLEPIVADLNAQAQAEYKVEYELQFP